MIDIHLRDGIYLVSDSYQFGLVKRVYDENNEELYNQSLGWFDRLDQAIGEFARIREKSIEAKNLRELRKEIFRIQKEVEKANSIVLRKIGSKEESRNCRVKCSNDFLNDLEACRHNPFWNLSDVGKKYGITRERVRQLYNKVYKEPYQPKREELNKEKNVDISCHNDPRNKVLLVSENSSLGLGTLAEKDFLQRCESKSLKVEVPCDSTVDLMVNGNLVEVKTSGKPFKISTSKTGHFHYSLKKRQIDVADFFACYHPYEDTFFIIPNEWKGADKDQNICISDQKSDYCCSKNRYWEYKDRYDLLA